MSGWIGAWGNAATVTNLTVTGSEIISVNTSSNALRITQTGTGNALVVEDATNPDSTPFVIRNDGSLILGAASSAGATSTGLTPKTQIVGTGATSGDANPAATFGVYRFFNDNGGPICAFFKSNSATPGTFASVNNNDSLGSIFWQADDGTSFPRAASIAAQVDGTPGTNDMPGRLVFSTTADGAASVTPRMTIDNSGNIYSTSGTTAMTSGFFYIPAAAGAPSGVPTAVSGRVPMYYDTTNNNFYIYNGAWKKVLLG